MLITPRGERTHTSGSDGAGRCQWRLLLVLGAVPFILSYMVACQLAESLEFRSSSSSHTKRHELSGSPASQALPPSPAEAGAAATSADDGDDSGVMQHSLLRFVKDLQSRGLLGALVGSSAVWCLFNTYAYGRRSRDQPSPPPPARAVSFLARAS